MALMINPVSSLSFKSQNMESIEDLLSRPGAYSRPEEYVSNESSPKKKYTFLKVTAGILITAGIIAGALCGLKNAFPKVFDAEKSIEGLEGMNKFKAYITKGIANGAEKVEAGANWIVNTCKNGWDSLVEKLKPKKSS